jgi:hypothetical protein
MLRKFALSARVTASGEATGVGGVDIAGIRAANIGHFTRDRLTAILGKLGQEVELAVSVKRKRCAVPVLRELRANG